MDWDKIVGPKIVGLKWYFFVLPNKVGHRLPSWSFICANDMNVLLVLSSIVNIVSMFGSQMMKYIIPLNGFSRKWFKLKDFTFKHMTKEQIWLTRVVYIIDRFQSFSTQNKKKNLLTSESFWLNKCFKHHIFAYNVWLL